MLAYVFFNNSTCDIQNFLCRIQGDRSYWNVPTAFNEKFGL